MRNFALILVGGKGKRLRPLSTNARPKAFLSVTRNRKTMFRVTLDRIKKIIPPEDILAAANRAHLKLVKKDFPDIGRENLLSEPVSRNTAPAITLAAVSLMKRFKDAVMVVLPADQYVMDEQKYLNSIKTAIDFVRTKDCFVVLGLKPSYPATGFGYIKIKEKGKRKKEKGKCIYKVEKFTEKPHLKTAKRFLKDGRYLWNAGAFVFKASSILKAVKRFAPAILDKLDNYKTLPDISIDYAVMEKARNIYCVKGAYRWRDIGSFEALKEVLNKESRNFVMKDGKIIRIL